MALQSPPLAAERATQASYGGILLMCKVRTYLLRSLPLKLDAGVNILPCFTRHLIYTAP